MASFPGLPVQSAISVPTGKAKLVFMHALQITHLSCNDTTSSLTPGAAERVDVRGSLAGCLKRDSEGNPPALRGPPHRPQSPGEGKGGRSLNHIYANVRLHPSFNYDAILSIL